MVDTVFRFVSQRPPQLIDEDVFAVTFARPSGITPRHEEEFLKLNGRELYEFAQRFVGSEEYVAGDRHIVDVVLAALNSDAPDEVLERALGSPVIEFLADPDVVAEQEGLWGSYYAQVVAYDARPEERAGVSAGLRAFHVIHLVADQVPKERLPSAAGFAGIRILVPKDLVTVPPADAVEPPDSVADLQSKLDELAKRTRRVVAVSTELQRDPLTLPRPDPRVDRIEVKSRRNRVPGWIGAVFGANSSAGPGCDQLSVLDLMPWPWTDSGRSVLSAEARVFLEERGDLYALSALEILDSLDAEIRLELRGLLNDTSAEAHGLVASSDSYRYLREVKPVAGMVDELETAAMFPTPHERGIRPLGIGDLMLVEEELLRYTAGEVAHIENVMAAEERSRRHQRFRETEEILITETERLEETEKDLQTTERFELHNEAEHTLNSEMSAKAGVEVTGSYGFVTVTAHGEFALSQSRSESERNSSDFAREVTERSVARITERAREERTRRTLERFEETNKHGFDNTAEGAAHIRGIYRWVDKYYRARLVNYGRRLLMEFVVPEPAAFYLYAHAGQSADIPFERPQPPMFGRRLLRPDDLTFSNVDDFVRDYRVASITPYPRPTLRAGASFAQAPGEGQTANMHFAAESDKFIIPAGYVANGNYAWAANFFGYEDKYWTLCVAGVRSPGPFNLLGLLDSIPVSAAGWGSSFIFQMVFAADRTKQTQRAWQLDSFDKIMSAYELLESQYQEALAAAGIAAGVGIKGRNPEINRQIEREELQRAALEMLTNHFQETIIGSEIRYYELFDAMHDSGPHDYPVIDTKEATVESKIVQFFEQAFEWQNMTYLFYPYFWGRMEDWDETFDKLGQADPKFASFLRAGSARVVVPARPAYTEAVLHYIETSAIWNGGEPPTIEDPLYVSIVEEIRARSDEQTEPPECGDGVGYPCIVEEWEVKVPTSLVWLQEDGDLPAYTGGNGGN